MTHFRDDPFYELTDFRNELFFWSAQFSNDSFSKWSIWKWPNIRSHPFLRWPFFEMKKLGGDHFSKWPMSEMIWSRSPRFGSDPKWPFFEETNFLFSKWSISKWLIIRCVPFFELTYFSKWPIFEVTHFRSNRFRFDSFSEWSISKWPFGATFLIK